MQAEGVPVLRLSLLWIGWCALHSLLITARMNAWVRQRGGAVQGLARLVYNVVAVVTLIPLLWYQFSLPADLLFGWHGFWRLPQAFLLVYAVVMFLGGQRNYDMGYFLGTRQWRDHQQGRPDTRLPFRTGGALRWVRHPWYSGGLALIWAFGPVTDVNLPGRIVMGLYFVVGSLLEEQKLKRELGEAYRDYCRRVPMLIPWRGPISRSS